MKKLILITSLIITQTLFSQIVTDRPTQGFSSTTLEGGAFQVEMGTQIGMGARSTKAATLLPVTALRYGISDNVEIMVGHSLIHFDDFNIFSDFELSGRFQILQNEDKNTEIALLTKLSFPTATPYIGDGLGFTNVLAFSNSINDKISLGYNIGLQLRNSIDLFYTFALGIAVNDKTSIFIEPYGAYTDLEEFNQSINAGFSYLISPNFQADFSLGTGISERMNFFAFGLSWKAWKGE